MTEIKFCGITCQEDIEMINLLKPDRIGFIFYPPSKRYITRQQAETLSKLLDPQIRKVGVFVQGDMKEMANLVKDGVIDDIQLHSYTSQQEIQHLKDLLAKTGTNRNPQVIEAVVLKSGMEEENRRKLQEAQNSIADLILLDAGMGEGKVMDWNFIKESGFHRNYLLAGGLNPNNVQKALEQLNPYGIDVSSGIEMDISPKVRKDPEKMKQIKSRITTFDHKPSKN